MRLACLKLKLRFTRKVKVVTSRKEKYKLIKRNFPVDPETGIVAEDTAL